MLVDQVVNTSESAAPERARSARSIRAGLIGLVTNKKFTKIVILALYAGLVLWLTVHHEPWRDEADAWLMARDNSFGELFKLMGYAGTPMLWYLMLWPFAKTGMPYECMSLLNAILGIAAGGILLFRAPFATISKVLFLFSYLFSYEYPIIARSYQLSILLIFAVAALHSKRNENPIIYSSLLALLANTNVHGLIIAASIGFVSLASLAATTTKPKASLFAKAALPLLVGLVLSVMQLWPPTDGQFSPSMMGCNWWAIPLSIKQSFAPGLALIQHWGPPRNLETVADHLNLIVPLCAVAATLFLIRRSSWGLSCFCLSWFGLMSLFFFKYSGNVRHWGFLVVMAIYAIWIAKLDESAKQTKSKANDLHPGRISVGPWANKLATVVFSAVFLLSTWTAVGAWIAETALPFSDARSAANFIKRHNLTKLPIAAYPNFAGEALLPYLPGKKAFYPDINEDGTNLKWNKGWLVILRKKQLLDRLEKRFGDKDYILVVSGGFHKRGFRCIYRTKEDVITDDEKYSIFLRRAQSRSSPD